MNKLLFYSLSLLMSVSAFSMEKELTEISDTQLTFQQKDLTTLLQMATELKGTLSRINAQIDEDAKVDPKEILKKFNEETKKTCSIMNECFRDVVTLEPKSPESKKDEFKKEHTDFEDMSDNLYLDFLIPETKSSKICAMSPKFYRLLSEAEMIVSATQKDHYQSLNDQVSPFNVTMKALLASLKDVKAQAEKKDKK